MNYNKNATCIKIKSRIQSNRTIRIFFSLFFLFNTLLLFSNKNFSLDRFLYTIISDHFGLQVPENSIVFENIIESNEEWSCQFTFLQSEYKLLIDNNALKVLLIDDMNSTILYEVIISSESKIPIRFPVNIEWVNSYFLYRNRKLNADEFYFLNDIIQFEVDIFEAPNISKY